MVLNCPTMSDNEFVTHYVKNAPQIMWFLGAGASVSAGMPTATNIIWDLKKTYYCREENQDIQEHDCHNAAIQQKIQRYMDSKGFPKLWSPEEYSFYFNLIFKNDYASQQKYIKNILSPDNISLNIGHRIMAALMELKKARVIFTTNFDAVVEEAFSKVTEKNLTAFHLEGSYAALEALINENFPIYAKIHGDFRYQSIKNLSKDLMDNDKKIQECFIKAASRFGLIVSGYSGRDENVMDMLHGSLEQISPFPHGVFWATTNIKSGLNAQVVNFINKATEKGIKSYIIETGTFDILLNKIWRQIENKPAEINSKIKNATVKPVHIKMPSPMESGFPMLRTNALPISLLPIRCASVSTRQHLNYSKLQEAIRQSPNGLIATKTDKILLWGETVQIRNALSGYGVISIDEYRIENPVNAIDSSTQLKAFYEEALAVAIIDRKPLKIEKNFNQIYITVNRQDTNNAIFSTIKNVVGYKGEQGYISGSVPRMQNTFWEEAVKINIEIKDEKAFLLLRPDIWISPKSARENTTDFLRKKKASRYNKKSNDLLSAWISILVGQQKAQLFQICCFPGKDFSATFEINSRSAYSRKEGRHA